MPFERVVAIGLLTKNDVQLLGPSFDRIWPIDDKPCFPDLLKAIDEADQKMAKYEEKPLFSP